MRLECISLSRSIATIPGLCRRSKAREHTRMPASKLARRTQAHTQANYQPSDLTTNPRDTIKATPASIHPSLSLFNSYSFSFSHSLALIPFVSRTMKNGHGPDSEMGERRQACHGEIKRHSQASVIKLSPGPVNQSNGQSPTRSPIGRPTL